MEESMNLKLRLDMHNLSYVWLIAMFRLRGYEIDKTTVCSAVKRSITGPRVEKIISLGNEIVDEYEKIWLTHMKGD